MKNALTYLIFTLLFWGSMPAYAQKVEVIKIKSSPNSEFIRFDNLTINNEEYKTSKAKKVLLHDQKGYLWISYSDENKLFRFDGNYSRSFSGKDWILYEENGHIFGKNRNSFAIFNEQKDAFELYKCPYVEDPQNTSCLKGNQGKLWFTQNFMGHSFPLPFYSFDTKTKRFKKYFPKKTTNFYTQKTIPNYRGFSPIFETKDKLYGICISGKNLDASLGYFDLKTNDIVIFPVKIPTYETLNFQETVFTFMGSVYFDGTFLWLGHQWNQVGLLRFDTKNNTWTRFLSSEENQNKIKEIARKGSDELWIMHEGMLSVFNTKTHHISAYKNDVYNDFSLSKSAVDFYQDSNQNLWFSLDNATGKNTIRTYFPKKQYLKKHNLAPEKSDFFRILLKDSLQTISTYNKDNFIFLKMKLGKNQEIERWKHHNRNDPYQTIIGTLNDTINNRLWFYGNLKDQSGLFYIDKKTNKLINIPSPIAQTKQHENKQETIQPIHTICQDVKGNLWFSQGIYLIKFDRSLQQFITFDFTKKQPNSGGIKTLMLDTNELLWMGHYSGEISWFDTKTTKLISTNYFKTEIGADVTKIIDDVPRKLVWISRMNLGLWQFNRVTKQYKKITKIEALYNFYLTNNGIMWLRTPYNLQRFNPETENTIVLGTEYGLTNFDWTPFTKSQNEDFYFGNYAFKDSDFLKENTPPSIKFSSIYVFDKPLTENQNTLNNTKKIVLDYDQNFFKIRFSLLSYFQPEKYCYSYRLDGFNKNWIKTNRPEATFTNVPPGNYTLKIRGVNDLGIWSKEKQLYLEIMPAFWQTWWFTFIILFLFLGIIFLIYRYQIQQNQLKNDLLLKESNFKQRESELLKVIAETEIVALRAQMNPHFIFNCLNSIKLYTLENNTEAASNYITKFSKLIRLVLENSRAKKVILEKELETLELYIQMEVMRFKNKITYQLIIDETIDTPFIEIPPLLIQPFVENAIWHGLMHKKEGGNVSIEIKLLASNLLQIIITDNGIGRQKSTELNSKTATKNKSYGMKVTKERIELINQLSESNNKINIVDLHNEVGSPTGTQVFIEIPIKK